jgi:lysophospholipase L1-like esterase
LKIKLSLLVLFLCASVDGQQSNITPFASIPDVFKLAPAPQPKRLLLARGDRIAICGDSITEQKMYSRLVEDYLTVCVPALKITVRQFGMGSETASGFLARMTNDCLRFHPTLATTCYGMNDFEGRIYEDRIGALYREKSSAIIEAFKSHSARVIQGSPGCVGLKHSWTRGTSEERNLSLCALRNIGIEVARKEGVGFADTFGSMIKAAFEGQAKYGPNFHIAGRDGVHPDWAGHAVMAYSFLKSFGLDGEIGRFSVDLTRDKLTVSKGHKVVSSRAGEFVIVSSRYPFCVCVPNGSDREKATPPFPDCASDEIPERVASGLDLTRFHQELNRLTLIVKNPAADRYEVTWGVEHKIFTGKELALGVNLAQAFRINPFCEAFGAVDSAVVAKQAYETKQIKQIFHGPEGQADLEDVARKTEEQHALLAAAIKAAFKPVTHVLKIVAQ